MKHTIKKGVFMKTSVFLIADFANLSVDRKLNVMGVFNQIYATKFPAIHPSMHLVIEIGLEPGESFGPYKMTVLRINENQSEKLKVFENDFSFPQRKGALMPKHTSIIQLRQIGFVAPGTYEFVIHINDRFFNKLPLHLAKVKLKKPNMKENQKD